MRTTLSIDDDTLAALRELARQRGESLGRVASDLIRRGLSAPAEYDTPADGLPRFRVAGDSPPITLADVARDLDDPY